MGISESWERPENPLNNVLNMDGYQAISNPFARKQVGGKPALVINTDMFTVENPNQTLIKIPWGVEIVWSILTPKHTNSSSVVKKIIAASFYCKPGSKKKTLLLDHISETYHFLSSRYPDGLFWIIMADKNEMRLDNILTLNPDFKQLVDQPTRDNPAQILDIIVSNLGQYYQIPTVEPPLEVDDDKVGSPSDHLMVVMTPLNNFQNKRGRIKKTIEYRPLTDDGYKAMGSALHDTDWVFLEDIASASDQMETFQSYMFKIFDKCFPPKKRTFFSENQPFFTEKLEKIKRRKCREYSEHRKSKKYMDLKSIYRKELLSAKKAYYRKKIHSLRTSNSKSWYKNIKRLVGEDASDAKIEVEDIRCKSDEEQCELIADKFAEVSNLYEPLQRGQISFPIFSVSDIPVIGVGKVLGVLKDLDPSKSTRKSDIPAKVLKHFSTKICKPLTVIVNNCIQQGVWPEIFKSEIVTPVPKVPNPKNIDDLRNISGLMNLNKMMEKLVCPLVVEDMKSSLDKSQFANQPGLSTQHYLIKLIDRILSVTDNCSKGECVAVLGTLIDWKKAFPMQDHTLGVKSFIRNGVRASLIPILASFFERRTMQVAWRGKLSSERPLPGSGPQGSSWGILEYLSQSNNSADSVPEEDRAKFMDDLTILEIILLANVGLASHNIKSSVPTNIAMHNQFIPREHLKTQKYVEDIEKWTDLNKMKLNEKKTHNIIFNFTRDHQFNAEIKVNNVNLEVIDKTKLLGAIITSDMKWHENTKYLVKKANKKMIMLHKFAKFTKNKAHLIHLFKSQVR